MKTIKRYTHSMKAALTAFKKENTNFSIDELISARDSLILEKENIKEKMDEIELSKEKVSILKEYLADINSDDSIKMELGKAANIYENIFPQLSINHSLNELVLGSILKVVKQEIQEFQFEITKRNELLFNEKKKFKGKASKHNKHVAKYFESETTKVKEQKQQEYKVKEEIEERKVVYDFQLKNVLDNLVTEILFSFQTFDEEDLNRERDLKILNLNTKIECVYQESISILIDIKQNKVYLGEIVSQKTNLLAEGPDLHNLEWLIQDTEKENAISNELIYAYKRILELKSILQFERVKNGLLAVISEKMMYQQQLQKN